MRLQSSVQAVLFASLFLWGGSGASAEEYEDLSPVETRISNIAGSGGVDADVSKLKDAAGTEIQTEGVDPPPATRRNVYVLTVNKQSVPGTKVDILVTGMLHGGEWVAYRVVLHAAEFIVSNRATDTWPAGDTRFDYFHDYKEMNPKTLTDHARIFFVPIVNPEAYYWGKDLGKAGTNGDMQWRKNRRDATADPPVAGESVPASAVPPFIGVDLNRNYPVTAGPNAWGTVTPPTSTSRHRWDVTYCGRPQIAAGYTGDPWLQAPLLPLVERETEGIVTLSKASAFCCHIDVHSYGPTVGWAENAAGTTNIRANSGLSDDDVFEVLSAAAAELISDATEGPYSPQKTPYPTSGGILEWQYEYRLKKCLSFLIEVGKSYKPADATGRANAVLPGMLFMMFAAVDDDFSSYPKAFFRKPGEAPPAVLPE